MGHAEPGKLPDNQIRPCANHEVGGRDASRVRAELVRELLAHRGLEAHFELFQSTVQPELAALVAYELEEILGIGRIPVAA